MGILVNSEDQDEWHIARYKIHDIYKKLYLKSAFNFNISNISHQG